jgi:4-amino-4-deoxy-L-arabinose transferase-like glycosyltransferase
MSQPVIGDVLAIKVRIMALETARSGTVLEKALWIPRESTLERIALAGIVALAAALRFADLDALGYANHYYTAAVKAMLQSWHNFFFVAAEPGGSVSVDKPPVGLWLQAISARFLGVNTLGVLLPQIVAGLLSVVVVYYLVRRSFSTGAGLIGALALAITPVVVATDRNNTIDSTLILTLLLAAWAFVKATETSRFRYLLLGAALVGIGFNIKMLEAYLPLPAFYALYFFGSKDRLLPKLGKLTLAGVVLMVISLSWATIVDLTPASQRPYVGSSGDNSELSLAIGYNGVERLLGMGGRGGLLSRIQNGGLLSGILGNANQDGGRRGGTQGQAPNGGFQPPPGFQPPQGQDGNGRFQFRQGGPGGGAGMFGTGQPGVLRLFTPPLSKEASWLLPFGLFGALILAFRSRLRWPIAPKHQAVVLWGGWLLTGAVFFSIAGFFHPYYLSTLGPPLAARVGIGAMEVWHLHEKHPWLALAALLIAAAGTLAVQITTAQAFVQTMGWLPLVIALSVAGVALVTLAQLQLDGLAPAGFACIVAAMLVTPGIWSGLTTLNSSDNQSLPAAYDGRSSGPPGRGRLQVNQALLAYVEPRTQDTKFLMAVPSSMQGADYVIATGRPVLYLGGFMGEDRVETSASLAQLVADGELRFIYWDGRGRGFGGPGGPAQPDISTWVTRTCKPVQGFDTATQNSGAPDGTRAQADGMSPGGSGGMQVTLYDCGG